MADWIKTPRGSYLNLDMATNIRLVSDTSGFYIEIYMCFSECSPGSEFELATYAFGQFDTKEEGQEALDKLMEKRNAKHL
jgi:hypothetical protein